MMSGAKTTGFRMWFTLMVACASMVTLAETQLTKQVLLISMDGFRWDYLDNTDTPNFDRFISQGVRVKKVKSVFSPVTFPNHWTLVTGLYEEQHGIVANSMYDPAYNETFSYGRDTKWFNETEPVWVTARRENLTSGVYMWVGNEAKYGADLIGPNKVVPFANNADNNMAVDIVINWLLKDKVNLACLYIDDVDQAGHTYGPNSEQLKQVVRNMDSLLGTLLDKMAANGLDDNVNIIITSDHGMAEVAADRTIDLSKYVNFTEDVQWSYVSVIAHILPKENSSEKVYQALKSANETHMRVYKREDIPERFHYKNHRRVQPIVLIADEGWSMMKSRYNFNMKGNHGFDNTLDSMQLMFVARGPNFRCGMHKEAMDIVDVYPLLCYLLDLQTCHQAPGSLESTKDMLNNETSCLPASSTNRPSTDSAASTRVSCPVAIVALATIIFSFKVSA